MSVEISNKIAWCGNLKNNLEEINSDKKSENMYIYIKKIQKNMQRKMLTVTIIKKNYYEISIDTS